MAVKEKIRKVVDGGGGVQQLREGKKTQNLRENVHK